MHCSSGRLSETDVFAERETIGSPFIACTLVITMPAWAAEPFEGRWAADGHRRGRDDLAIAGRSANAHVARRRLRGADELPGV